MPAGRLGTNSIRAATMAAALALIALTYWPGLSGAFLFDDYPNLHGLEKLGDDPSPYAWVQYIFDGKASTLGRPIANLTFALQHTSWHERPQDFLRFNLLLHLLNAALWFAVVARLQRLSVLPAAWWLPAAACAVWALLPVQGGAVLYVVQRMTLLATAFTLAGTLLYVAGRATPPTRPWRSYGLMSAGVLVALVPGSLAKESAALAPLLILVLEATLLRPVPRPERWRAWSAVLLWLPTLALAAYLCLGIPEFLAVYEVRPFSPAERLLTEARVLFVYLARALLPSAAGIHFHYDDLALSTSVLKPWTTLLALAGWSGLVAAAIGLRHRVPLLAFAVGWYLAAHALESSFIPLELAFDHRNYTPSLGPVLALCAGWSWLLQQAPVQRLRKVLHGLGLGYVAVLAVGMWFSADLWGKPLDQARFWVQRQPESRRAVYHYGDLLLQQGRLQEAAALFRTSLDRWPMDTVLGLASFRLGCNLTDGAIDGARAAALLQEYDGATPVRIIGTLQSLAEAFEQGACADRTAGEVLLVVTAALDSPWLAHHRVSLLHAGATILHAAGRPDEALAWLERAIALDPQVALLQWAVKWSLEAGDAARARRHLATAETSARIPARTRWTYREEIRGIRQLIELYESLDRAAPA